MRVSAHNPVEKQQKTRQSSEKKAYEAPTVIFESEITTRAGSPTGLDPNGIDPTDLFDN